MAQERQGREGGTNKKQNQQMAFENQSQDCGGEGKGLRGSEPGREGKAGDVVKTTKLWQTERMTVCKGDEERQKVRKEGKESKTSRRSPRGFKIKRKEARLLGTCERQLNQGTKDL